MGGCTPCTAVYGRVPRILPDISCQRALDEQIPPWPGTLRDVHRLREAAVEAMVQASAKTRLDATWRTHATRDGRSLQLKPGDSVDFNHRDKSKHGNKDKSRWRGPAEVFDVSQILRGTISIKTRAGKHIHVSTQDIRPHLSCFVVFLCIIPVVVVLFSTSSMR